MLAKICIHIHAHTSHTQTQELLKAKQYVSDCLHRRSEDAALVASLREQIVSLQTSCDTESRSSERLRSELAAATERMGAAVARAEDMAGKLRDEKRMREEVCLWWFLSIECPEMCVCNIIYMYICIYVYTCIYIYIYIYIYIICHTG